MNLFKILSAFLFLVLCFVIYIGLSDESHSHNLQHLFWMSFLFTSSLFYEMIVKKVDNSSWKSWNKSAVLMYILGGVISVSFVIFLIYARRFDLLPYNEPYSFARFVYVFGVVAAGCLMGLFTHYFVSRQEIKKP